MEKIASPKIHFFRAFSTVVLVLISGISLVGCGYQTPQGGGEIIPLVSLVTPTVPFDRLTADANATAQAQIARTPSPAPVPTAKPATAVPASDIQKPTPTLSVTGDTYTVQSGDTLLGIAIRLKVDYEALIALNKIADPNSIKVGQKLKLPGISGATVTASKTP